MKRINLIMLLIVPFMLAGCMNSSSDENPETTQNQQENTPTEETQENGNYITINDRNKLEKARDGEKVEINGKKYNFCGDQNPEENDCKYTLSDVSVMRRDHKLKRFFYKCRRENGNIMKKNSF